MDDDYDIQIEVRDGLRPSIPEDLPLKWKKLLEKCCSCIDILEYIKLNK